MIKIVIRKFAEDDVCVSSACNYVTVSSDLDETEE